MRIRVAVATAGGPKFESGRNCPCDGRAGGVTIRHGGAVRLNRVFQINAMAHPRSEVRRPRRRRMTAVGVSAHRAALVLAAGLAGGASCADGRRSASVAPRSGRTDAGTDVASGAAAEIRAPIAREAGHSDPANDGAVPGSRHEPFIKRQCHACHVAPDGLRPQTDMAAACRSCHAKHFEYTRYAHGPAAAGDCMFCHGMHVSAQAALLKLPQTALCVQCHEVDVGGTAGETYHRSIERRVCTECHEAHSSDTPGLLKPGVGDGGRR